MRRHLICFLSTFVLLNALCGQNLGDYYVCIPIDSVRDCRLKFLNSTYVELSNVPRHMSGRFSMVLTYVSSDTTIEILTNQLTAQDSLSLKAFGLDYFIKPRVRLAKINGGFIDYSKSLIYIRAKDFGSNPDLAYIIDGKTYIQDIGVRDGYGLIKKKPKTNRALQKRLKTIDKDNCTIEIVKGLNAYQRFGIQRVYGAIVIITRP